MGSRLIGLGNFFRYHTSVDRRYIELAILVTGQFWQADFEWYAHEPMARKAGVPDEVITDIRAGRQPTLVDEGDVVAYELASELHRTRRLSDMTYEAAVKVFGERGVAELVGLCGYYSTVSMTLNAFDVDLPEGARSPFEN